MLNFAYGSNMDWDQMRARCPSARFVGKAVLRDYKLAFTRLSTRRKCGVSDVIRAPGDRAWGVVYEIDERDLGRLDKCEGYWPQKEPEKNAYLRREAIVFVDDDDNRPLTVAVYFANRQKDPPLPNKEYKDLILSGARHWHLPDGYIRDLEGIKTTAPTEEGDVRQKVDT
jgi:gamma-glutamylcyclotransferase